VRYLLDTHTLLWALSAPGTLSVTARDIIASPSNVVLVSSASLWECAIKASIGKLELPDGFFESIPDAGYEIMPILISHLNVYRTLPMHHRDPFDRILVAQAQAERITLISRDAEIAKYEVEILLC
jgi:PIN domain nuclease of toxin-antitoxin system